MSELSAIFDSLGQDILPEIGAIAFPDTMRITGETTAAGTGGGRVKSAALEVYDDVPVTYEPMEIERRLSSADKLISLQQYKLTFPTHYLGFRLEIDVKQHKFIVNERGNEPEKVFKVIALRDISGVVFEAICDKEN
jgi:hypothetical protein